jgi:penicillin amidase
MKTGVKKINADCVFPLGALVGFIFALTQQMFSIPPLGKLLNPFVGVVQNENPDQTRQPIACPGLSDSVDIFLDARSVPHIYAKNKEDLYFSQGYMAAYFRLWQMDFLSYAAAGRLSEIFTDGFLDYDRNQRRIGMLSSASTTLDSIEKDPETEKALTAYSKGVNAYIEKLSYKNMPFEYKLLDYKPERWTNLKTVLIMKYIANMLSGYEEDYEMSNLMLALGEKRFNQLFPNFPLHITPVVTDSSGAINPGLVYTKKPTYLDYSYMSTNSVIPANTYNPKLGSNSWVVSGEKTNTGYPILCNDPHLGFTLPSIWLEMQLACPGLNVYGVSIPGVPAIIIGFNQDIAWGLTNGADDVKDWYKLKISADYKKYEFDGKWMDLKQSVEEIKRRGRETFFDTVYSTIQGPIVADRSFSAGANGLVNFALSWELHNASNEFLTFIRLNEAKNYTDYRSAIKYYSCPSQNFTFACRDNTIAVDHQGKMAIKQPGEGRFLLDGTQRAYLLAQYIPEDSLPHLIDPACHYVLSANQHPTNSNFSYYYNGYYNEDRAGRIHELLSQDGKFDVTKMEAMQLDNTNYFATEALPELTGLINIREISGDAQRLLDSLKKWNAAFDADDELGELFELWWANITTYTWDEFSQFNFHYRVPDGHVLLDLIRTDPGNDYFDEQATPQKENARDIVNAAFRQAVVDYMVKKKQGKVRWGDLNKVRLMHPTNIKAFSVTELPMGGHPEAIDALSPTWGPTWRMIVTLGPDPKGYGIYAGGQSGNIGSPHYDDFIKDWQKGSYYPLHLFKNPDDARAQTKIELRLQSGPGPQ